MTSRGPGTSIRVPKRTLRVWPVNKLLKFDRGDVDKAIGNFEGVFSFFHAFQQILTNMIFRIWCLLVTHSSDGFNCSLSYANICLCALANMVLESSVRSITFLILGGLFPFCASTSSSAIKKTADAAQTNPFWISELFICTLKKWHTFSIFRCYFI